MNRFYVFMLSSVFMLMLSTPLIAANKQTETAVLAGGCFWCIESDFEKLDGVLSVQSGYAGGDAKTANYKEVSSGRTRHLEVAEITYDPSVINYPAILDYFWHHIDPTRDDGQFCDYGAQYRPAIFYQNPQQKALAQASMEQIEKNKPFKAPLKVELIAQTGFYPAENYHQDYYKKNPVRYKFYRYRCGRDQRVEELWGKH